MDNPTPNGPPSPNLRNLILNARRLALIFAPVLILLLALALRLFGINWDQGGLFHPDERAILFRVNDMSWPPLSDLGVLLDVEESPLNPQWFPYGSLPLYAVKIAQTLVSPVVDLDFHSLRFLGRMLSSLADVGTVLMVFLIASRLYGRRVGILASLLAALAVVHIQLSHFYTVDTYLTFFITASVYFMVRLMQEGRLTDSALSGVFIGLALASKISVAPLLLAWVLAHVLYAFSAPGEKFTLEMPSRSALAPVVRNLLIGGAACLLVFFIATPYAFLDWSRPTPCEVPYSFLEFLDQNYYACDLGGEFAMARGISGRPYTQQYIDTAAYWYHIRQLSLFGLGLPLGIVAWASVVFTVVMAAARRRKGDLLILAWILPYFLLTGYVQVKFLRYMLPLTPFLLIFGSRMLFWVHDLVAGLSRRHLPLVRWGIGFVVAATAFYALSYAATYAEPHTAKRASAWINENVPTGSVILMEHWEESIPDTRSYIIGCRGVPEDARSCMTMYDHDGILYPGGRDKMTKVAEQLAGADYLVFFSNRLYGSIPRLPEKYPQSGEYYRSLFAGELGYRLEHWEAAYPRLMGIAFVDDTFARPGLPTPREMGAFRPAPFTINLGYADESFSAYDRPKVLIFRNMERLPASELLQRLLEPPTATSEEKSLLLPESTLAAQREGGTWSAIFNPNSLANRFPVVVWLLWIQAIALLGLPLSLLVFKALPDRGYLLAKPLSILLIAYIAWMFASLHWMPFSRSSILLAALLLAAGSLVVVYTRRVDVLAFFRENLRLVVIGEALFLTSFALFLLLRAANPDLWHPFNGGEKPMEMAYLNAVVRSSYMPPYDPWFAGGYINYYYFGQFIVASIVKVTGITTEVAFNLAVPLFFALTTSAVFSLVYNLAEGSRRSLGTAKSRVWAILAGLAGAFFVAVMGNLDGAIQLGQGLYRVLVDSQPFGAFDFWRSSRLIPPGDPPGYEITEFPFFTFLFGDLHAHMMAIPFALLSVGLALTLALRIRDGEGMASRIAHLLVLALAIGSLRAINTWDYPTQLAVGAAAVLIGEYARSRQMSLLLLLRVAVQAALLYWVTTILFAPFIDDYRSFADGVFFSKWQTPLYAYLGIHALFVFLAITFLVYESRSYLPPFFRTVTGMTGGAGLKEYAEELAADSGKALRLTMTVGIPMVTLITLALSGYITAAFLFLLLIPTVMLGWRWASSEGETFGAFAAAMLGIALLIGIMVDIVTIKGDIARMNTVFKFYLQAWVLMGIASAYLLWRMDFGRAIFRRSGIPRAAWLGALAILVIASSMYTVGGTRDRLRDRFEVLPLTLNGMAYMEGAEYSFDRGAAREDLKGEYDAIQWLRSDAVEGSPVVLEGHGELYRSLHTRVAIYTGLPTVIGWDNHQSQQRGYGPTIQDRLRDVQLIYSTSDIDETLRLLDKYQVEYIYVGEIERHYYPQRGLDKFSLMVDTDLDLAYSNPTVEIYRVLQDESPFDS